MTTRLRPFLLVALLLAACSAPALPPTAASPTLSADPPTAAAAPTTAASPTVKPTAAPPTASPTAPAPAAVEYDLGEAVLTQARFPLDSRFRSMPVRLNGVIAAPAAPGPHPLALIFHGNHPGCPLPPGDEVDRWPCDPAVEQPNYRGLAWLAEELAAAGYAALSININAENTFGFGEPVPGERLEQLLALHLQALQRAAAPTQAAEAAAFGLDLAGRVDLQRMVLIGHSRGGEAAAALAHNPAFWDDLGLPAPRAVLLVAAAVVTQAPPAAAMPTAVLLPACDADVVGGDGQYFFEAARLDPQPAAWVVSAWLEAANHNFFNSILQDENLGRFDRPDCETLLDPQVQREFLARFAVDFLAAALDPAAPAALEAAARLGLDPASPAPAALYGLPARTAVLAPPERRSTLLTPLAAAELTTHRLGGSLRAENLSLHYCQPGFSTPAERPGSEPCRRVNLTLPGNPAMAVVEWQQTGAALHFDLPAALDLSDFAALSLRLALDPLAPLNPPGAPQSIRLRLEDASGASAVQPTRPAEPALAFPPGIAHGNDFFAGGLFSGPVPLTTLRFPLSAFGGVDRSAVTRISLLFDRTPSGTLFLADVEVVK